MSTQRRENRWRRTSCTDTRERIEPYPASVFLAWLVRAIATVGTAPPRIRGKRSTPATDDPSPGTPEWLATNSLQLDHRTAQLSSSGFPPPRAFAAPRGGQPRSWHAGDLQVIPSAHPLPFRTRAFPSLLAAVPSRLMPLDGKVRWQKRFASPARRMKRGWQFLKTISSRKSITNAKTSTPWPVPFTTAASPASCPACSPPLWTWAWSATPSSM